MAATSTISLDNGGSETDIINWLNKHEYLQEPPTSFTASPRRKHRKHVPTTPTQKPAHPLQTTSGRYNSEQGQGKKEEMIELTSFRPPASQPEGSSHIVTVLADQPITQWGRLSGKSKSTATIETRQGKEVSIVLIKAGSQSLGFSLCGGRDSKRGDIGLYVRAIQEGGAAYKDGRMKPGDELIAVNGVSMKDYTHKRAAQHIKVCIIDICLLLLLFIVIVY